jgi:hypothetical protein
LNEKPSRQILESKRFVPKLAEIGLKVKLKQISRLKQLHCSIFTSSQYLTLCYCSSNP